MGVWMLEDRTDVEGKAFEISCKANREAANQSAACHHMCSRPGEAEWPVMAEALSLHFRLVSMSVLFLGLVSGHIKPPSGRLLGLPARKKHGEGKGQ